MRMSGQERGFKTALRGAFARVFVAVLCLSVLAGITFSIAGCQLIDDLRGLNGTNNSLSETELARLVANAINSESSVADSYAKIPSNQLDGLSYSIFYEYCSILRQCSQVHGTADSFIILNDTDKTRYFNMIDFDAESGDSFQTISKYGDMDVIELCYSKDKNVYASPVRFTIAKSGDSYSISGRYIYDSIIAYSYINHYFEMIDDDNVDGLEAIIKSSYDSDIYLNSVIHGKAQYIADYYRLKVKSNLSNYQLRLFSPTHVQYYIPEVLSEDGEKIISKTVDLRLQNDGNFFLEDEIPVVINEIRLSRVAGGRLRLGSTYTANELYKLLGNPIVVSYDPGVIVLTYDGMTLKLEGDTSSGQWNSGRLSSVVLRKDDKFNLGDELFIGMNLSELLLIYPMIDESDFVGSFENGDGEFILSFRFDEYDNVTRIRVGEAIKH